MTLAEHKAIAPLIAAIRNYDEPLNLREATLIVDQVAMLFQDQSMKAKVESDAHRVASLGRTLEKFLENIRARGLE